MTTDLRDLLQAAGASAPSSKIDAHAILRAAQRRRLRNRLTTGAAVVAIVVLAAGSVLGLAQTGFAPGVDKRESATVLAYGSGGHSGAPLVLDGIKVPTIVEEAPLHNGEIVVVAGRTIRVQELVMGNGANGPLATFGPREYSMGRKGRVVYGFAGLHLTHGLVTDRDGRAVIHTARVDSFTFYWAVLPAKSAYHAYRIQLAWTNPQTGKVESVDGCGPFNRLDCPWAFTASRQPRKTPR